MEVTISEYASKCLREEGVTHIFTVAAEQLFPLLKSINSEGIKIINAKLELSAGFMALVYARLSGKPGVLALTSGPGVIGAASPIAQAFLEGDPIVLMTTAPPLKVDKHTYMHQLPNPEDQLSVFHSITKQQFRVRWFSDVPGVISSAFSVALSDKPGPVYLEFPFDILTQRGFYAGYESKGSSKPSPPSEAVKLASDLLIEAKQPVILAGRGVYLANARKEIMELAELLDAPIAVSVMAKGLIPHNHPLNAGVAAGRSGNKAAQELLKQADVVLSIGNRFSEMGTGRYSLEIKGKLIHVNVTASDIGRAYKPFLGIISDAKAFLKQLLAELKRRCVKANRPHLRSLIRELWSEELRELKEIYEESAREELIKPWEVINAVREVAERDAIIITDIGAHRIESFIMPIYEPNTYIASTSYVSMGIAVPGAVAASLVNPSKQVVALVGDGGFLMTGLEIATAVQNKLNPVIIVFNDSSYRVIRIYERVKYGSETRSLYELPRVDFSLLAESLGAKGLIVKSKGELRGAVEEAFENKGSPTILDVHVDSEAIPIPFQRLYGAKRISELRS